MKKARKKIKVRKVRIEMDGEDFCFSNYVVTENAVFYKISFFKGNRKFKKVKKGSPCSNGYSRITFYGRSGKKLCRVRVHRVMARTFLGPCPKGKEVNHKDGDKSNDYYKNLEYVTRSENTQHAYDHGLHVSPMKGKFGELCPVSRMTENNVRKIKRLYTTGKYFQEDIAEIFGVSTSLIQKILQGKNWSHVDPGRKYIYKRRILKGEDHPCTKLCNDDVIEIRRLYSTGKYSHRQLAIFFGLKSKFSIGQIVRGETWTHLL